MRNFEICIDTQDDVSMLPVDTRAKAILKSSDTEAKLVALAEDAKSITTVSDQTDRQLAHSVGMRLKGARVAIERAGKSARDDAVAFSKAVIAEEGRLKAIIEAEEKRVIGLRDGFDDRKAAEKARKEQAERERVEVIQSFIASIRAIPANVVVQSAAAIKVALDGVAALQITEDLYAEFLPHAADAKDAAVSQLIAMHQRAVAAEEAQAAIKAQQEELARLKAEAEAELTAQRAEIARQKQELEEARTAAEAARLAEQQRINAAAARAAAAEAEREAEEARQAAVLQEDAFAEELAVAEQELKAMKVEATVTKAVDLESLVELAEVKAAEIIALPIVDVGFDGIELPAAPVRAPHVNQPLPIDMIELPVVGGKPADMDIVVAVADAFDVSIEVALDYITSINVQAVVEAIAEAA